MIQGCSLPSTIPSPSPLTCSNDHPCKGWDLLWSPYRSLWSFGKCAWARRRAGFQKRDNRPPFRTLILESSPAPAPWRRSLPSLSHEALLFLCSPKLSGLPIGPSKATETIRETSAGINPPPSVLLPLPRSLLLTEQSAAPGAERSFVWKPTLSLHYLWELGEEEGLLKGRQVETRLTKAAITERRKIC